MPKVDTAFTDLLDEMGAAYTGYYCGSHCRVYDYLDAKHPRPNKAMHLTSTPLALRSREVMGDVGRKS